MVKRPVTLINPPDLPPARGYSHLAIAEGSRVVSVAGQVAVDQDLSIIGADDLAEQTRAAMRNLGRALAAADVGWEHVVRRTIYTTQPTEYQVIAAAIDEVTGGAEPPAQSIIGVTGLARPGLMIEIEATAVAD